MTRPVRDGDRIEIPYEHDHANTQQIAIAVARRRQQPAAESWRAAYRDVDVNGRRVVWARFPDPWGPVDVWIRDDDGERFTGTVIA